MANDFSGDSNCKALWRFESGALAADSKGGNTLTNSGVAEDTSNYKEGLCSALYGDAEPDAFNISDANLDSGFPLKSGETNRTFSLCFWLKLTVEDRIRYMFRKYGVAGSRSFAFYLTSSNFVNFRISPDGTDLNDRTHETALVTGRWYHIALTYDNSDYSYRIRIWDDTAQAIHGSDKAGTATDIFICDSPVYIGYPVSSQTINGNLDEQLVFDDVLSIADIDAIRAGTYGGGPAGRTVLDYERKTRGVSRGVVRGAA